MWGDESIPDTPSSATGSGGIARNGSFELIEISAAQMEEHFCGKHFSFATARANPLVVMSVPRKKGLHARTAQAAGRLRQDRERGPGNDQEELVGGGSAPLHAGRGCSPHEER